MFNKKKLQNKDKEIEELKQKLMMQNLALVQMNMEKREMYLSPNEFILSRNQTVWKDIKISFKGKDITNNSTKLILFGHSLL